MAHLLENNICKINSKLIYIYDVLHPDRLDMASSRLFGIFETGKIVRLKLGDSDIYILSFDEQINAYNNYFYKFLPVPSHLKQFIEDKEKNEK